MAKVLITGAAGFIGSHTAETVLAAGHAVVGVDNFRTGREENLARARTSERFRFHRADVTAPDFPALVRAEKPDALLHLAALVSVPESIANPELNDLLNVRATTAVLAAARAAGSVRRVAFASSAAVYGDNAALPLTEEAATRPLSPYGEAKLRSEGLLAAAVAADPGLSTVALRYFNVFGPRQDPRSPYSGVISIFATAVREGRSPTVHGDGGQTRDFVSVADVARANLAALTVPVSGSLVANVCTGRATSLLDLLAALAQAGGFPPPVPTLGPARAGDIRHSLGSPDRAREKLGFAARDDLATGLRALFSA
jgi:UDP-glucose 4-epimerase